MKPETQIEQQEREINEPKKSWRQICIDFIDKLKENREAGGRQRLRIEIHEFETKESKSIDELLEQDIFSTYEASKIQSLCSIAEDCGLIERKVYTEIKLAIGKVLSSLDRHNSISPEIKEIISGCLTNI